MKKFLYYIFLLVVFCTALACYLLFSSATNFDSSKKQFVIEANKTSREAVLETLLDNKIIKYSFAIKMLGNQLNIWQKIKPGKYEVKRGENIITIVRMLKNSSQMPVNLIINKLRTKEDFAKLIAKNFSTDSAKAMQYLCNNDSLQQFEVDTTTLFTTILPNTYTFYWNTSLTSMLHKLHESNTKFWNNNNRLNKANSKGFSATQIYILASIIEEETNHNSDRSLIASVYINRLKIGMPLQACPTIKYAMKNFTLTRIYEKYLAYPSAYNTYKNKGLPPGPICTPSPTCIDIVLNAPATNYLYFVANANFDGYHHFSSTYQEHNKYAKAYQQALDIYTENKQNKEQ